MPKAVKEDKKSKRANSTSRHFSFTDYDVSEEHIQELLQWDKRRYIIVGEEICPKTKKPHLQCYVQFPNAVRFSAVKKIAPKAHIEDSKGTDQDNWEYCSKDGKFHESGKRVVQGQRVDLEEIRQQVKEGRRLDKICWDDACNLQQLRFAQELYKFKPLAAREPPRVVWISGPAGAGKTRQIWDNHDINDIWESKGDGQWYDGYYGHGTVIIDEFRQNWCRFSWLLRLLDRYPLRVPVKGGFVPWEPKHIYITSNKPPIEAFSDLEGEDIHQLLRRIHEIIEM